MLEVSPLPGKTMIREILKMGDERLFAHRPARTR